MQYWDIHKAEMINLFDENYPADQLPKWVDYAGFRNDMVIRMLDYLIIYLTDEIDYMSEYGPADEILTVDFSAIIGFALIANNVARDGNTRHAEYLCACISVSTAGVEKIMALSDTKR